MYDLMAFACKRSKDMGFDGAVAFKSKTTIKLLYYYIGIVGASHFGDGLMVIDESVAERLIKLYLS